MAQAIDYLFVTNDVDGIVTLGDKLVVKDEFKDLRSSNAKLNYHYKKGSILKMVNLLVMSFNLEVFLLIRMIVLNLVI